MTSLPTLIALARAAKERAGGQWFARGLYIYRTDDPRDARQVARVPAASDPNGKHPIAEHIAAANPTTVLALCERVQKLEALREAVECHQRAKRFWVSGSADATAAVAAAYAEVTKALSTLTPRGGGVVSARLTDQQLRRMASDAEVARGYYARHGNLPTSTGLDVIELVPRLVEEAQAARAQLTAEERSALEWLHEFSSREFGGVSDEHDRALAVLDKLLSGEGKS